jgi:DNA-binding transcriptional ArsR family regulator
LRGDERLKEAILNYLMQRTEGTIGEIAKGVGASRPTISKYLKVLEAERKVKRREQLPYVYYSLSER